MKNNILKKGCIVFIISLLIAISVIPSINAKFNQVLPITENKGERNECFVEVTCHVSTLTGIKQVKKDITRENIEKIINFANEINIHLGKKDSIHTLHKKVTELVYELKENELLPKGINTEDTVKIIVNNLVRNVNSQSFLSDNHSENRLCFLFGTGDNDTSFLAYRQSPIILLRILLWEALGLDDPYIMGPFIRMLLFKPKFLVLNGQWVSYSTNATLISAGLNGVYIIKNEGFGAYCLLALGFIGISVGSSNGGFICGFCFYSDIYFNPIL
jgi:hypothetical protein